MVLDQEKKSLQDSGQSAESLVAQSSGSSKKEKLLNKEGKKKFVRQSKLSVGRQRMLKEVDLSRVYSFSEALTLLREKANQKFKETLDVGFKCNLDTTKGDHMIRAVVSLPQGAAKTKKIAVFARGDAAEKAKSAGADIVGGQDLVERIQNGFLDFDFCVATPDMMPLLTPAARILGPRGLMPNPKIGTVTNDVESVVKEAKKGQAMLRADKQGWVRSGIGRIDFSLEGLEQNFKAVYQHLMTLRPEGVKGAFLERVVLTTTQGLGLRLDLSRLA